MSSEASLPQCLNCQSFSGTILLEEILVMCVLLGGTPFVFLVITVLCIATRCVLQKSHSLTHLNIFAVCVACCICYREIRLNIFSWLVKFVARFRNYRSNCASDEGKYGHLWRDVKVH